MAKQILAKIPRKLNLSYKERLIYRNILIIGSKMVKVIANLETQDLSFIKKQANGLTDQWNELIVELAISFLKKKQTPKN